jgi:hypothetical protein
MSNKRTAKAIGVDAKTAQPTSQSAPMPAVAALIKSGYTSTSAQMRELSRLGFTKGAIAKHLGKRYQHVYNVLSKPVKAAAPASATENVPATE